MEKEEDEDEDEREHGRGYVSGWLLPDFIACIKKQRIFWSSNTRTSDPGVRKRRGSGKDARLQ